MENSNDVRRTGIVFGQHKTEKRQIAYRMRRDMTPMESRLWERLRAGRLGGLRFRRQQIIDGFIVDFFCFSAGLVVEVDGPIHDTKVDEDKTRTAALEFRNLKVIRFSNARVLTDLDAILFEIEQISRIRSTQLNR